MSDNSPGSSATETSVSVNQRTPSSTNARISSFEVFLLTKVLSSANSMKGLGQICLIVLISLMTLDTGFTLYRGVSRMELAQKSHCHGQPRWVEL